MRLELKTLTTAFILSIVVLYIKYMYDYAERERQARYVRCTG